MNDYLWMVPGALAALGGLYLLVAQGYKASREFVRYGSDEDGRRIRDRPLATALTHQEGQWYGTTGLSALGALLFAIGGVATGSLSMANYL